MAEPIVQLLHKTAKGPAAGIEDWYYHFKGYSGNDFIIHEFDHVDPNGTSRKGHNMMSVSEFMMMGKYPQLAKDKLRDLIKV